MSICGLIPPNDFYGDEYFEDDMKKKGNSFYSLLRESMRKSELEKKIRQEDGSSDPYPQRVVDYQAELDDCILSNYHAYLKYMTMVMGCSTEKAKQMWSESGPGSAMRVPDDQKAWSVRVKWDGRTGPLREPEKADSHLDALLAHQHAGEEAEIIRFRRELIHRGLREECKYTYIVDGLIFTRTTFSASGKPMGFNGISGRFLKEYDEKTGNFRLGKMYKPGIMKAKYDPVVRMNGKFFKDNYTMYYIGGFDILSDIELTPGLQYMARKFAQI